MSGTPHVSRTLVKRYLSFIDKIRNSSKVTLKQLLGVVQDDVRLTTGSNLRKIMMLLGENQICELGLVVLTLPTTLCMTLILGR